MFGGIHHRMAGRPPSAAVRRLLGALSLAMLAGPGTAAPVSATAVKATYLYKLAPFVDWPAGALGPPGAPFVICVIGHDPFGALLDRAVAGQQAAGRPIVVRRLAAGSTAQGCAIGFIGGPPQEVRDTVQALGDAPLLTVTDGADGAGVIDLVLVKDNVRFRIDEAQAAARHLKLGSQLLGLAVSVNRARGGRS